MKSISLKAYAKINLSLDILGKLPNGYHSVKMIMQQIPLCDTVEIETSEGSGIEIFCSTEGVPTDHRNSAYKGAELFLKKANISSKVRITLDKKIPAAAGMAGGSTDAAAVLKGLNELFDYPLSEEDILGLCLKIGADVPFCYMGGCALSEGIGEVLTPLSPLENAYIVIGKPQFDVSTAWVYQNFRIENVITRPDTEAVISAIKEGTLTKMAESTANVLETVTEKEYPVITEYKNILKEKGALLSMMSGSGPTVFGIFDDLSKAETAYKEMQKLTPDSFLLKI